jgi:hypothetical protein
MLGQLTSERAWYGGQKANPAGRRARSETVAMISWTIMTTLGKDLRDDQGKVGQLSN